ncbi:TPA: NYN domain-containing protein, partial [Pseudomonas aeruginosa]
MSRPESPAAKKIAVFADVQNLYYTVRQAYGCHLNYAALWADIARGGSIVEA